MKDYLKVTAIIALFLLGSASDTYASDFIERDAQEQHRFAQQRVGSSSNSTR